MVIFVMDKTKYLMALVLMGYMGSGKTSHCKRLANRLKVPRFDLDLEIERFAKASVSEIFAQSGESVFRDLEQRMLRKVLNDEFKVLALGGGTPCFHDNMAVIKDRAFSVYLKMEPKLAFKRLKFAKIGRPLIEEKGDEELESFVKKQIEERAPFYNQADMIVDADKINAATLDKIKEGYDDWAEKKFQLK
ncbi:MAG: shikimate kinase [Patiriisocius sp.]|jgi:shikimate kinase